MSDRWDDPRVIRTVLEGVDKRAETAVHSVLPRKRYGYVVEVMVDRTVNVRFADSDDISVGWEVSGVMPEVGQRVRCMEWPGIDGDRYIDAVIDATIPTSSAPIVEEAVNAVVEQVGCGKKVVQLPAGMDSNLSLATGGGQQVFVHGANRLLKYSPDLAQLFNVAANRGTGIVRHQAGTDVPANMGDVAYSKSNGILTWTVEDAITAIAHAMQDQSKFWVTGSTQVVYVGFKAAQTAALTFDDSDGRPAINWQPGDLGLFHYQYFTGGNPVTIPGWTLIGDNPAAGNGSSIFYRVLQAGDTQVDIGGGAAGMALAIYRGVGSTPIANVAIGEGVIAAQAAGDTVVAIGSTASGTINAYVPAGMTNRSSASGFGRIMCADTEGDFAGDPGPGALFERFFSVGINAGFVGGGGGTANSLQVRNSTTGAFVNQAALTDTGTSLRASPTGTSVFVQQGPNTIKRYDRTPTLEATVTITAFFPCDDWNVDDANNIYRLAGGVLKKYGPTGTLLWTKDLFALHGYRFPTRMTISGGTGQQVVVDSVIRVAGYFGNADWTVQSEGVILILSRSTGDMKATQRFGGAASVAQVMAVHMNGQCMLGAAAVIGTEFYGVTTAGQHGFVFRVESATVDTAGEGGNDPSHTHSDLAPATPDYLVGTAQAGLTNEIVVGTGPGGELGGTWPTPIVDLVHSGSSHAAAQASAEATAAAALAAHAAAGDPHAGYATDADLAAHAAAADPHAGYASDADLTAHLNDTTAAHAASAISIADAGNLIAAGDVEGALQELAAGGGGGGNPPSEDTMVWMPLTTVVGGEPVLVWDADDSLIPTLVPLDD